MATSGTTTFGSNLEAGFMHRMSEKQTTVMHAQRGRLFAYRIKNIVNGKIYIGVTGDLAVRVKTHRYCKGRTRLARAFRKYGLEKFTIEILYEAVNRAELYAVERGLIAEHGARGATGYNLTIGGEGGAGHRATPETCAKISASKLGKKNPKTSASLMGRSISEETRRRMSEAAKRRGMAHLEGKRGSWSGRKHTEETIKKMSASATKWQTGRTLSDSHKASISAVHFGRRRSAETRAKISIALINFHATENSEVA